MSQIFDHKTPYFSRFNGSVLVLGGEILSNCPMDTDWTPKTKEGAMGFEIWDTSPRIPFSIIEDYEIVHNRFKYARFCCAVYTVPMQWNNNYKSLHWTT